MENETLPSHFYFTQYKDQGDIKYVLFLIMLIVYFAILVFNVSTIVVVTKEKSLHEPMYIFISCLCFNSLYGSAGLFPRLSIDLLSDSHVISRPACFTQIYVIYTYSVSELTILATMAYDRYVAICHPLHYHNIMTPKMTALLVTGAFSWSLFWKALVLYLAVRLPLCGNLIMRLYCSTWSVVRLSCVPTGINNAFGLFVVTTDIILCVGFTLYTYTRILVVCRRSSSEIRGKALQTCLPHIITFVTYSLSFFCDIILSRFELDPVMKGLALFFSLEFLVIPPIFNPLIYGLTLPEMRRKNPIFMKSAKIAVILKSSIAK
ncbi:olfactory receptor 142-like [Denticeps clupeoides]|uniref:Olfactory receptor n=1 Tax=Denticeps clupeoides TaxID=299321 RepID=A0A8C3YXC3_9TELE|nr:olfactory receptor 142-like [Denticeps clupeoides]XP_028837635.1 olfactory receptor 142-like [Denticeps clupeoides]